MSVDTRLRVVLCWHMHQPQYRDLVAGDYRLPWVYLHAIKDYVDMAAHLEANPKARAVVNFAPILLEQIEDYTRQLRGFIQEGGAIRDPILAALVQPALPVDIETRLPLIKACLRANEARLISRFPPYARLAEMASWLIAHPAASGYLNDQFLADLVVWYHLAWVGETVRRTDGRVQRLMRKEGGYTLHDRHELLHVIHALMAGVLDRYRRLAASGRVELSMTPYAHPILPLLLDIGCAREAMPDAPLPLLERYPAGEVRARWHLQEGLAVFERCFGLRPVGCWPSEGALSAATLDLLADVGFTWTASGEGVLRHTLAAAATANVAAQEHPLHRPYVTERGLKCFFRDDGLSDLIGFTYATWHGDDAVNNLVHQLENIADQPPEYPKVVAIIMDGENAWEHYPENAYHFLGALYRRLSEHPRLLLTTFSECAQLPAASLPPLVAGSWVYGTLSTWIGDRDKNRGWDMLGDAANTYAARIGGLSPAAQAQAQHQLAICEGSDWFWWFGDYNPAATVSDFEHLYRLHLTNLYQLLGAMPPDYLSSVFTRGAGAPVHGGTMRPGQPTT